MNLWPGFLHPGALKEEVCCLTIEKGEQIIEGPGYITDLLIQALDESYVNIDQYNTPEEEVMKRLLYGTFNINFNSIRLTPNTTMELAIGPKLPIKIVTTGRIQAYIKLRR